MQRVMVILLLVTFTLAPSVISARLMNPCGGDGRWESNCTISNPGTQVDIGGTATKPAGGANGGNSSRPGAGRPSQPPAPTPTANACTTPLCRDGYTVGIASEVYPEVSVADLASFRPRAASAQNEPAGAGVVGMPSNVVADASTHELQGALFGFPVAVTFIPVGFTFDFGDGTGTSTTTGGASWRDLGQAEFTPTATSHVFRERGTYRVTVHANYRASVLFDGGFRRDVAGVVRGPGNGFNVRVVTVSTALVEDTCLERPGGPGC